MMLIFSCLLSNLSWAFWESKAALWVLVKLCKEKAAVPQGFWVGIGDENDTCWMQRDSRKLWRLRHLENNFHVFIVYLLNRVCISVLKVLHNSRFCYIAYEGVTSAIDSNSHNCRNLYFYSVFLFNKHIWNISTPLKDVICSEFC